MSEITESQRLQILGLARSIIPDVEFAPEETYYPDKNTIAFKDKCGCYSEWTTEACSLEIFLKGTFEGNGVHEELAIEDLIDTWAQKNIHWDGCECCENKLYVDIRLFKKGKSNE